MIKNLIITTLILISNLTSEASDNFYSTSRYFDKSGRQLYNERIYRYNNGRTQSFYYSPNGSYLGKSYGSKNKSK